MSDIRIPQNPGIGGLDELTTTEESFLQNIAALSYQAGDMLYYNGSSIVRLPIGNDNYILAVNGTTPTWEVAPTGSGLVDSVNGQTGTVVLDADDIDDALTTNKFVTSTDITNLGNLDTAAYEPTSSFASALGVDDNYVTDAEKTKLSNLSGTNTGDQTSIVGITGTIAQFNTALSDGDLATGGGTATGTNTGDNATNTQYSGLAASKADVGQTFYIGTTQVAINRASAELTLAGIVLTTPNIGTPSAGTLTNCTGLPIAGLVASTSTAIGVGSVELGHASDTTISRVSAGVVAVEGVTILTETSTNTLTNKTIDASSNTITGTAGYILTGYSPGSSSTTSMAASTTYYVGNKFNYTPSTSANFRRMYFPKAGTIKKIHVTATTGGTQGSSGEDAVVYFRLNNTSDTTIMAGVPFAASQGYFANVTTSIAVVDGDYGEIKIVTPAWTTLPHTPSFYITIYVE